MNITLSLVGALLLLFPGLTAIATWNLIAGRGSAHRPELPLTAVSALFIVLGTSLVTHMLAYLVVEVFRGASLELPGHVGLLGDGPPVDPFAALARLTGLPGQAPTELDIVAFVALILAEAGLVAAVLSSRGLDIALNGADLRSLGWAHRHYLEPLRHGYTPIAFVLTSTIDKGYGVGFEGPIEDLRLGEDRQVKMLSLGQPERFLYELRPRKDGEPPVRGERARRSPPGLPDLVFHPSKFVGGVINIEASTIRNLVIHNYLLDDPEQPQVEDEAEEAGVSETTGAVPATDSKSAAEKKS